MHGKFAEAKMAAWHRLFRELEQARSRLQAAQAAQPLAQASRWHRLEAEVDRLEAECDWALIEIAHAGLQRAERRKNEYQ